MAHICNTEDDGINWRSRIKGNDDGEFEIKKENGQGLFSGKHKEASGGNKDLFGKCFEEGGGKPHRIWFVVPATDHLYMGKFTNNGEIHGQRFTIDVDSLSVHLFESDLPPVDDDGETAPPEQGDDWVATKT